MQEENIDILNEDGYLSGNITSKNNIHKFGYWHNTVHIWILNIKNELLLQKRHSKRKTFADLWDVSVAGHVSSGEDIIDGAIRETYEEIGLDINKENLKYLFKLKNSSIFLNNTYINNEFFNVFLYKDDIDIKELSMQIDEVSELKFISIEKFLSEIRENITIFANRGEYYKKSIEYIKKICLTL